MKLSDIELTTAQADALVGWLQKRADDERATDNFLLYYTNALFQIAQMIENVHQSDSARIDAIRAILGTLGIV